MRLFLFDFIRSINFNLRTFVAECKCKMFAFEDMSGKIKNLILSVVLLGEFSKAVLKQELKENLPFPLYISSLISQVNEKDPTKRHDITLFRLEKNPESSLHEEVFGEILKNNPDNPVYSHMSSNPISPFKVQSTSLFIVTTDLSSYEDLVS